VRQFCANANARLQACADEDAKGSFLLDHVERVIYEHYEVTLLGSMPLHTATGSTKLSFRIVGTINIKKVRSEAQREDEAPFSDRKEISRAHVRANATRLTMAKRGPVTKFAPRRHEQVQEVTLTLVT
jgi:hypothetical protein